MLTLHKLIDYPTGSRTFKSAKLGVLEANGLVRAGLRDKHEIVRSKKCMQTKDIQIVFFRRGEAPLLTHAMP
jgi:hypothetical protein